MTMTINNEHNKLNVPNLRFKEFQGEWEKCKLSEICTFFSGGTPSSSNKDFYGGNIAFIRSGELHADSTELFITQAGFDSSSAKMVEVGDLLLAMYGATSGDIAVSKIKGAINQAILCIRTKQNKKFIESVWNKHVSKNLRKYLQGGQGNLSADIVKGISFFFPTLKEQEKIANLVSLLDERITTQNKTIEDLKKLKYAISHILFSSKFTNHLSYIANVVMGQSPSSNAYNDQGIGMPLVQGNLDISNGKTTPRLYTSEFNQTAEEGNIILTVRAPVGEVAKATKNVCLGRGVCAIIPHEENMSDFIYQYLTFYKFMWRKYEQGSTFTSINGSDVRNILCPEVRNVSILTLLDSKISTEERVVKLYQKQKQYLLRQMFI